MNDIQKQVYVKNHIGPLNINTEFYKASSKTYIYFIIYANLNF